ncbi:MAG: methyl-accepting chemotaxis protein [Amphritea sp.]
MLSVLLSPAIGLMNRLNYLYKFTLINVLFLVPLLGLAYMQLDELAVEQRNTQVELKGMNMLRETLVLTEIASEMRDLLIVQGSSLTLETAINKRQAAYLHQIGIVQTALATLENTEKLEQSITRLQQMNEREWGAGTLDIASLFVKHNQLVLESWILVHSLSYHTGLYQDKDAHNFLLMKLVLDAMEPLLEHQGELRSFSTVVVKAGAINSSMMEVLNRLLDDLISDQKRLDTNLRPIIAAEAVYGTELMSSVDGVVSSLKQSTDHFDNDLLMEEQLDHDWQQYYKRESDTREAIYSFVNNALVFVDQRLQQRESEQNSRFYALLLGILAVFLVTNYLMLGFNFSVRRSIQAILNSAERVAQGDLTTQVTITNADELGQLAKEFNRMTQRVRDLLAQVTTTVQSVASQAGVVDGIAQQSSEAIEMQRQETEQVASAINQMVSSVQEVANKTLTASQESTEVDKKAGQGQLLVKTTLADIDQLSKDIDHSMEVIHRLVKDSDGITQVLDVIKGVAEQTNLLALNAAIEAARAGEQGRGFAVVADEVRTLAQRTQQSTAEIEQLIIRLQAGVSDAVKAMQISHDKVEQTVSNSSEVGRTLEHISEAITSIVDSNAQIASAGEEQTMVSNEIERNVQSISLVGTQTAAGAQDTVAACHQMADQIEQLKGMVATFKL